MTANQRGFTLIELMIVIVITGILVGISVDILRKPVETYMLSVDVTDMQDIVDDAFHAMADISTAIPNSVRMPDIAGSSYAEFLPTLNGGLYLDQQSGQSDCNQVPGNRKGGALAFNVADTCFDVLGPPILLTRGATDDLSDQIIIGSIDATGNPPYDKTYAGDGVRRPYMGETGYYQIVEILGEKYPAFAELDSHRFQVVPGAVQAITYACENVGVDASGNGTGTLKKYWLYGFSTAQLAPPLSGSSMLLADRITHCQFSYQMDSAYLARVNVTLAVGIHGGSISFSNSYWVDNTP